MALWELMVAAADRFIVLITSSDKLVGKTLKTGNHLHHAISRDEEEARESTRMPQMIDFWISAALE